MKNIDIFPWDEHFNTGVETIDAQHRKLVEILNRLATLVAYESSKEKLSEIFDELTEYTLYHFETEEAIWYKYLQKDSLYDEHEAVHHNFIEKIQKLKSQQEQKPLSILADEALGFLARWLASHILESDRYMVHVVKALEKGLSIDAAKVDAQEALSGSNRVLIEIILSIYSTLSKNTLSLMRELQNHTLYEKKVIYQDHYRDLLIELASSFINIPLDEIDTAIESALEKMATFIDVDRAYIFDFDFDAQAINNTYEWCAEGIAPQIEKSQNLPLAMVEDWVAVHTRGEHFLIEDVNALPQGELRDLLVSQDVKSLVTFALMEKNRCIGMVGFDAVEEKRVFVDEEIALLKLFSALLANVTDRKTTQTTLVQERSFLKTFIQAIPDLVWMKDPDGIYLSCNERFEQFFGAKEAEIVGKTDYDFVGKSLADFFRMHDNSVMQSGEPNVNEEEIPFASDGHKEIVLTTKVPVYDAEKKLVGVLGIARDITQRKELELANQEALVALNKAQSMAKIGNWTLEHTTGALKWSDEIFHIFEIDKEEFGASYEAFLDAIHPEDREMVDKAYTNSLITQEEYSISHRLLMKDGRIKYVQEQCESSFDAEGNPIRSIGTVQDITQQKKDEEHLRLAASVFTNTDEGILITSSKNIIVEANKAVEKITGYTKEELIGKNPKILSSDKQDSSFYTSMWEKIHKEGYFRGELWNRRKDGTLYAQVITISTIKDEHGRVSNYIGLFSDITLLKEQQEYLEYIAHYDMLTGLPNRILLTDRLHQAMAQTRRNRVNLAVVFLDLDGFKAVNDKYGHESGDMLLKTLALRMKKMLREGDTIARLGGDEFVVVLPDLLHFEDAIPLLEKLLGVTSQSVAYNGSTMEVSSSIGVAIYNHADDTDADVLLRYADQAMYEAKLKGKNRFRFFDSVQDNLIKEHSQQLKSVVEALKAKEFMLYYQPKVNMRSGKVVGFEALIRWQHPTKGLLSPALFLPIIEGSDVVIDVGEWVLNEAISQIAEWKSKGLSLVVSINIDAPHLLHGDFIPQIQKLLKKYPDVNAGDFILEILETSALENISDVIDIMQECQKLDISFSLDDFGTGYSSLTYLKRLPASELKIDMSFIRDMLYDPEDLAILDGVIGLANSFGRNVVAEGVEEIKQGEFLVRMGCEVAQGYAIAKPMPAVEVEDWVHGYKNSPKWEQSKPMSRDDLPILYASVEHTSWVHKVVSYARGSAQEVPEQNHHECRFGRWFYTLAKKHYGRYPKYATLEEIHIQIHNKASQIIQKRAQGSDSLEEEIEELSTLHLQITELLQEFID